MTSGDAVRKVVTEAVNVGVNIGLAATQSARARAEDVVALVRKEIAAQLAAMGLATKADLADLEARLAAGKPAAPIPEPTPEPTPEPIPKPRPRRPTGGTTAAAPGTRRRASSP
ncbi:MAG: hypothetical protein ACRD1K_11430 [Acidimicrobiales bacterium]